MARGMVRQADGSIRIWWNANNGRRIQQISTSANGYGVSQHIGNAVAGEFILKPEKYGVWDKNAYRIWWRELNNSTGAVTWAGQWYSVGAAPTLAAPATVSAVRTGSDVTVTFTASPHQASLELYTIYQWNATTSAWDKVTELSPTGAKTFVVTSAGTGSLKFAVRGSGYGMVTALRESNTVGPVAAPSAPTNLSPNGTVVATGSVSLFWRHNPTDGSTQAAYQIRHRPVGATSWTTLSKVTSANQYASVSLSASASDREWQVMTWGVSATGSDWSAVSTMKVITKPTVSTLTVANPMPLAQAAVTFVLAQTQSLTPMTYTAFLKNAAGVTLETLGGTASRSVPTTITFSTWLENAATYSVIIIPTYLGVEGTLRTSTFTTSFALPGVPVLTSIWDEDAGGMVVTTSGAVLTTIVANEIADLVSTPTSVFGTPDGGVEATSAELSCDIPSHFESTNVNLAVGARELVGGSLLVTLDYIPLGDTSWVNAETLTLPAIDPVGILNTALPPASKMRITFSAATPTVFMAVKYAVEPVVSGNFSAVDADYLVLHRSVDGGTTWETLNESLSPDTASFTDYEALSNGDTRYRLEAWSNLPSVNVNEIEVNANSPAVWLQPIGAGMTPIRLPYDPQLSIDPGRERGAWTFGASKVAYEAEPTDLTIDYAGKALGDDSATHQQVQAVAQADAAVFCHRDPHGRRVYGWLTNIPMGRLAKTYYDFSYSLSECDRGLPWSIT